MLHTQEHIDLIAQFERDVKYGRFDKEPKGLWPSGHIYQDPVLNQQFLTYRYGYAFGKAIGRDQTSNAEQKPA